MTHPGVSGGGIKSGLPFEVFTVDNFESGSLNDYSGDLGGFSVVQNPSFEGNNSLKASGNNNVITTDQKNPLPKRGDKIRFVTRVDYQWNGLHLMFASQGGDVNNSYQAGLVADSSDVYITLYKDSNDNGTGSKTAITSSYNLGDWALVTVDFGQQTMTAEAEDAVSSQLLGSTQISDTAYDTGYIGWDTSNSNSNASNFEMYADNLVVLR